MPRLENIYEGMDLQEHAALGLDRFYKKWRSTPENARGAIRIPDDFGLLIPYYNNSTCNVAFVDAKGKISAVAAQGCHGGIQEGIHAHKNYPKDCTPPWIMITPYQHEYPNKQAYDYNKDEGMFKNLMTYYDWLLNRSPWADTFITKDSEYAFKVGVGHRLDVQNQLLIGGAIAYRHGWEQAAWVNKYWNVLVTNGMNENLAFILGQAIRIKEGKVTFNNAFMGHMAINVLYNEEGVRNFLNDTPSNKGVRTYTYNSIKTYSNVNKIWGNQESFDSVAPPFIIKLVKKFIGEEVKEINQDNNIFRNYKEKNAMLHVGRDRRSSLSKYCITEKELPKFCTFVNNYFGV